MGVAIHVLCDFVTLTLTLSLYLVEKFLNDGFGTISEWKSNVSDILSSNKCRHPQDAGRVSPMMDE